jgi:hypothetical protein
MVAAYALSLQLVLSGMVGGHFHPDMAVAADGTFPICHTTDDAAPGDPQAPTPQPPCMLCTLGQHFSSAPPLAQAATTAEPNWRPVFFTEQIDGALPRHLRSNQHQRGPPAGMIAAG